MAYKGMLLVSPFIVLVFLLNYLPTAGWLLSIFDYRPGDQLTKLPYIGFKYFIRIFHEWGITKIVLRNTFAISGLSILMTPIPVIFAIIMSETKGKRYTRFVQTVTTLPNFISWILVFSLTYFLFSQEGMLNPSFDL